MFQYQIPKHCALSQTDARLGCLPSAFSWTLAIRTIQYPDSTNFMINSTVRTCTQVFKCTLIPKQMPRQEKLTAQDKMSMYLHLRCVQVANTHAVNPSVENM